MAAIEVRPADDGGTEIHIAGRMELHVPRCKGALISGWHVAAGEVVARGTAALTDAPGIVVERCTITGQEA